MKTAISAVSAFPVESQSYITRMYTTDNGLPHNNVRNMVTDSSGFLWIATWDGLSRFDGYEFRNYSAAPFSQCGRP